MKISTFSLVAALGVLACRSLAADSFGSAEPFKSGDVVCFVGDSITHGGSYHSIVTLYYATRFPEHTLNTWNCGIGGDRANGIMADEKYRLGMDILGHKPTAATIMLGMNDIGHTDYDAPGKDAPDVEKKRARSLEVYADSMQKLIATLQKAGARITLITPSPYDEKTTLATAKPPRIGANGALGKCAEKVHAWAKQYHTGVANFYETMNAISDREQAKNPTFTLIGPDRVHPGAVGHFVMAFTLLKAQKVPGVVATIGVDAKKGKASSSVNCIIGDIKAGPTDMNFDCTEKALPLVVPDEAKAALALVPFEKELNEEKLVVTGLAPGTYELLIDHQPVGKYTPEQLRAGVNLAENDKTPMYQQSAIVTQLNTQRHAIGGQLRSIAAALYPLSRSKVDVNDSAVVEQKLTERAAGKDERTAAGAKAALAAWKKRNQLEKDYANLTAKLYEACQTKSHHFALAKK